MIYFFKNENSIIIENTFIRRYFVLGSRRFSNYCWATIILIGGIGFFLTGISSYFKLNILPFINSNTILFFPQGIVMCFYGAVGILFSLYLWLTIYWSIGGGYNEFNKKENIVRIFRWGFPGKNRKIDIVYSIKDIESIKIEFQEGLNPRRTIYMCVKGKKPIPLTRIGQPFTLEKIEKQAADLAKFLQVNLE